MSEVRALSGERLSMLEEVRPPEFSDEALALSFAEAHANLLRYVAAWSKWLKFDGKRWADDATLEAFDLARHVCRAAAARCNNPRTASAVASAKTRAAVEQLARSDRRLAGVVDEWDSDPWLLNTPGGVVNLSTGKIEPHSAAQRLTKITAVASGGVCPRWLEFLARITGGDVELQRFIARVLGLALTGITREHALFFGHGPGGNGKSVLLNTVSSIMGDYAKTAPIEVFTAAHGDRHPTELAGLRGARLVTAIETEEGRHWAEARIKALTGGDRIAARFMRQDFFEYVPQFKLVVAGNHKPGLRSVDEAIRRRLHLIPFTVTIPADERDPDLPEKLKAEWPGILAWMIEGCREWQRIGLAPPAAVTSATEAYLSAEDSISAWLSECCWTDPQHEDKSSALFASWKRWAEAAGESCGTQKRWLQNMEVRGFPARHTRTGSKLTGIAVIPNMAGGQYD